MKNMKKLIVMIAIVLCISMAVSACAKEEKIAAIAGDDSISVTELENTYNNYASYASYYGYDTSTEDGRHEFLDYLLSSLASQELLYQEAVEEGYSLTDEEIAEAEEYAEEQYQSAYQQYVDAYADYTDGEATAKKQFAAMLANNGLTVKTLKENILESKKKEMITEKYQEDYMKSFEVSEETMKETYDTELESQKEAMKEENATTYYFTLQEYYPYGYTYMPLVVPEGLFYVKQILVEDEDTAKEVLSKINAGESFEALIEEYNTDPGMESSPEGYVCGEGAQYVDEFQNAALALEKEGDVSDIVKSDFGYHIIKRYGNVEAGVIPYEEVKDEFEAKVTEDYQSEQLNNYVNELIEEITKYTENYYDIGA